MLLVSNVPIRIPTHCLVVFFCSIIYYAYGAAVSKNFLAINDHDICIENVNGFKS